MNLNKTICTRLFASLAALTPMAIAQQQPITGTSTTQITVPDSVVDQDKVLKGFKISPVPLNLEGKNPRQVGLGAYLVITGGCNDCHTNPSYLPTGDPFMGMPAQINAAGFLAGGQSFGPFISRNLTPDPNNNNLPGGLTYEDFEKSMRTGADTKNLHPQMGPLLQVMPWPAFSNLTNGDLRAIYAYLSAIPAVSTPPATLKGAPTASRARK